MDKFNYTSYIKNNPLHKEELKDKLITESLEVSEEAPSTKMKVSEFKSKIKEEILSIVQEKDEIEVEDEIDIEDEAPIDAAPAPAAPEGLSDDEKTIQDALKVAYDNAIAIGDEKLADQIGNSITFFTRTHVVER